MELASASGYDLNLPPAFVGLVGPPISEDDRNVPVVEEGRDREGEDREEDEDFNLDLLRPH